VKSPLFPLRPKLLLARHPRRPHFRESRHPRKPANIVSESIAGTEQYPSSTARFNIARAAFVWPA
jgi:hypothetical protein